MVYFKIKKSTVKSKHFESRHQLKKKTGKQTDKLNLITEPAVHTLHSQTTPLLLRNHRKVMYQDFPGGSMANLCSQCKGLGFDPDLGN